MNSRNCPIQLGWTHRYKHMLAWPSYRHDLCWRPLEPTTPASLFRRADLLSILCLRARPSVRPSVHLSSARTHSARIAVRSELEPGTCSSSLCCCVRRAKKDWTQLRRRSDFPFPRRLGCCYCCTVSLKSHLISVADWPHLTGSINYQGTKVGAVWLAEGERERGWQHEEKDTVWKHSGRLHAERRDSAQTSSLFFFASWADSSKKATANLHSFRPMSQVCTELCRKKELFC